MKEFLKDIMSSMRNNSQRIKLTGLSIAWGIFILMVLLGLGNSIVRGSTETYLREGASAVALTPGITSIAYGGYNKDRHIVLHEEEAMRLGEILKDDVTGTFPEKLISARLNFAGEYCNREIWGELPGYICTTDQHIEYGRDLSFADQVGQRKVCVISRNTGKLLFGDPSQAIGQTIRITDVAFKVVGVYATNKVYIVNNDVYMPLSTLSAVFSPKDELQNIRFKLRKMTLESESLQFSENLRKASSAMKACSPKDMKALKITNLYTDYIILQSIQRSVLFFVWFIGIATLISGIVGVSNIMTITVRERTREFGILRCMGATKGYIISLVLGETVIVTLSFGYVGLFLGIGVTQLLASALSGLEKGPDNLMGDPSLSLGLVLAVTLVMVVSGLAAGLIPARKALKMKLVDSLTTI